MNYTSSVSRITNDQYIVIRASYVKVCNGNTVAAALISFFESWHNYKIKQIREWKKDGESGKKPSTWQHHTGQDLIRGIMGIGKRHSIDQAKEQLLQMGIITTGRNPDPRFSFDATIHYQFHPETVQQLLAFVEISKSEPDADIDISGFAENNESPFDENSTTSPNESLNNQPDHSSSAAKAPEPRNQKVGKETGNRRTGRVNSPGAEKDHDWQRWVDRWDKHYRDLHDNTKPMLNGVQLGPSGLKGIRKHLCEIAIQVGDYSRDDCGFFAWDYILTNWARIGDDFLCSQFDLTVILKKINDILNRLKNGTQKNRNGHATGAAAPGTSQQRIDALEKY